MPHVRHRPGVEAERRARIRPGAAPRYLGSELDERQHALLHHGEFGAFLSYAHARVRQAQPDAYAADPPVQPQHHDRWVTRPRARRASRRGVTRRAAEARRGELHLEAPLPGERRRSDADSEAQRELQMATHGRSLLLKAGATASPAGSSRW